MVININDRLKLEDDKWRCLIELGSSNVNFLRLQFYYDNTLKWNGILEIKGDEYLLWTLVRYIPFESHFSIEKGEKFIGKDIEGDLWVGKKNCCYTKGNNKFFTLFLDKLEPILDELRAEIIMGE